MADFNGKLVVVTGGAGYIGSILLRRLLENNYKVLCLDYLRFGGASLVDIWDHPNFSFKKIDITDFAAVDEVFASLTNCFGIVHLAAIVGDPACKREPELTRKINVDSTKYLINKAQSMGIERFIFASTCSNYGKMADGSGYVTEDSTLAPVSLYAETKVEVENYILKEIEKTEAFAPTCLRFATVYGMSPRMRFDLTVNEFTKELALKRELVIFGEQFWRPYCYVGDFSRAIMNVFGQPKQNVAYDVFNVGDTSENYTKKMLATELQKVIPDAQIKYVKKDEDPRDYRVNFDKIKSRLDFSISKTVPQAIKEIMGAVSLGIIENPDEQRYYNIPVK